MDLTTWILNKLTMDKINKAQSDTQEAVSTVTNLASTIDSKIASKANKADVNTAIANMGSASPKGTYATLSALQTAFPTGTTGIYVVTADGKWYYWSGTAWTAGGVYQSTGIAESSITNEALDLTGVSVPTTFRFSPKQMWSGETSAGRVYSMSIYNFKVGDTVLLAPGATIQYALFDNAGTTPLFSGWSSSSYTFTQDISMYVGFKKADGSSISDVELPALSKMIYVTGEKTIVNYERNVDLIKKVTGITNGFVTNKNVDFTGVELPKVLSFSKNNYYGTGTSSNRLYSTTAYYFKAGDRLTIGAGYQLSLYKPEVDTYQGWTSGSYVMPENMVLFVGLRKIDDAVISAGEIDTIGNAFTISSSLTAATINDVKQMAGKAMTLYVSPDGSDSNDGETSGKPLATFQKAIDMGARVILAERKVFYNQTISCSDGRALTIKPYGNEAFALDKPDRAKINIRNGKFLTGTLANGLYTFAHTGSTAYQQVFIDKTLDPLSTGSRPSYNAGLWQNHLDWTLDEKLKPVLTLDEVKAERGTFTWDGTTVTVNPLNNSMTPTGFTAHTNVDTTVAIRNAEKVTIEDLTVEYSLYRNLSITNCKEVKLQNVVSKYTMFADGVQLDDSNGLFHNCKSHKARNDGFNLHGYGDTHFYDCEGHYNGDDGISHHDGCTGSISNGYFSHNGKSGIAPTYGSIINLYNNLCTDHPYNYYCDGTLDYNKRTVRHFGNVSLRAGTADLKAGNYDILGRDNNYTNKALSLGATYTDLLQ